MTTHALTTMNVGDTAKRPEHVCVEESEGRGAKDEERSAFAPAPIRR